MFKVVTPNSLSQPKEAYLLQRSQYFGHLLWEWRTEPGSRLHVLHSGDGFKWNAVGMSVSIWKHVTVVQFADYISVLWLKKGNKNILMGVWHLSRTKFDSGIEPNNCPRWEKGLFNLLCLKYNTIPVHHNVVQCKRPCKRYYLVRFVRTTFEIKPSRLQGFSSNEQLLCYLPML